MSQNLPKISRAMNHMICYVSKPRAFSTMCGDLSSPIFIALLHFGELTERVWGLRMPIALLVSTESIVLIAGCKYFGNQPHLLE